MSDMCKIQGTPWHVGRYTRQEGDERRHKSNCVYYRKRINFVLNTMVNATALLIVIIMKVISRLQRKACWRLLPR